MLELPIRNTFHNRCLRRICNIYWPKKISNGELYAKTECYSMATEVVARTRVQKGTEKESQEGLKMESSRQKETVSAKNDHEKTFEGDLKKMELT